LIWFEVLVGFALPVAWGVWQLWDLRREKRRDEAKRASADPRG
jgi:hypothetical protein